MPARSEGQTLPTALAIEGLGKPPQSDDGSFLSAVQSFADNYPVHTCPEMEQMGEEA